MVVVNMWCSIEISHERLYLTVNLSQLKTTLGTMQNGWLNHTHPIKAFRKWLKLWLYVLICDQEQFYATYLL